ncbi:MAG: AAA family ATPase [Fibrobacter sp.]|nr:AAA family ATPase [Fibrobacter sp.]
MAEKLIVGRKREIELLNRFVDSDDAEFIAVFGRRRVGKTYLVKSLFQKDFAFYMTGLANSDLKNQLKNFCDSFSQYFSKKVAVRDWFEAFALLRDELSQLKSEKKIVFIDELPWFDTARSDFVSALEHFWNSWASDDPSVKLIVCGSATSWMMNKLINNKGGLHNRVTHQIRLAPFTLGECEEFLKAKNFAMDRFEIAQFYMVFGGIPYYLKLLDNGESLAQNVDRLLFSEDGELRNEFQNLYQSLFRNSEKYIAIVEVLAQKMKGISRKELIQSLGKESSGAISRALDDLENCGFIRRYSPFGKKTKDEIIQLIDSYTLFHFRFLAELPKGMRNHWLQIQGKPQYYAWCGYSFEMLCLQHYPQILNALGISGIESAPCSWMHKAAGAQFDLLIDRVDNVINVCEMKFSETSYEITQSYLTEYLEKIESFKKITKTRKSPMLTFVTSQGLKPNSCARQIQRTVELDQLFG